MTAAEWTDGYGGVRREYDQAEELLAAHWASAPSGGAAVDRPFMARLLELEHIRARASETLIAWILANPPSS